MRYDFDADRKIIHVDMDAFFAAVEQKDKPELKGVPIAVGGGGARGVVAAASYEARKFGVRSAMSGRLAEQLCPELVFVKPRFERYKEVSLQVRSIFTAYTDKVEPLSLDEAYLDVTQNKKGLLSATMIAEAIRNAIFNETGLTASAGISINKFLAKVASDWNKPNGQKTIPPEDVLPFLEALDIKKFYGVGKKTADRMYQKGIYTGADLKKRTIEELVADFGKSGGFYYKVVRGIHTSPVQSERTAKSIGAERTFDTNLSSELFLEEKLMGVTEALMLRLERHKSAGKTITLKLKYSDFTTQTRSKTLDYYIADKSMIFNEAKALLYQERLKNSVRLIGITLSNFKDAKNPKPAVPVVAQLKIPF
jgi:DNA polymerase-4